MSDDIGEDVDEELGEESEDRPERLDATAARGVLDYLAKAIVDDPDSVTIEAEERRRGGIMLRLHVAPDDMGKIIGKRGRVAQAIRQIVRAAGAHEGDEVTVDIVD